MRSEFIEQFHVVFDEKYNIKACCRSNCVKLINLANQIKPGTIYGNSNTGFMHTDNLIALYNELNKSS